jgi:hypothetical protein
MYWDSYEGFMAYGIGSMVTDPTLFMVWPIGILCI